MGNVPAPGDTVPPVVTNERVAHGTVLLLLESVEPGNLRFVPLAIYVYLERRWMYLLSLVLLFTKILLDRSQVQRCFSGMLDLLT